MKRAVRTVLRLIAAGMLVVGAMNVGLEFVRHRMQGADIGWWRVGLGVLCVVLGVVLFIFSNSLAERLTDDFEE